MSKRLIVILACAFMIGLTCAAYAEVQNVKVSGDLAVAGFARNNFNLNKGVNGNKSDDNESNIISQVRLKVDADLTDNVMATVRLISERSWGREQSVNSGSGNSTQIDLDLAYATMKEFLFSPLTLTIGRQELRFGNGLIIANARHYYTNAAIAGNTNVLNGVPSDMSMRKSFDAFRATLNFDPLVIDLVAAKVDKVNPITSNDINLYGINARYDISKSASAEVYLWNKQNQSVGKQANNVNGTDQVYTVGALFSASPIKNLRGSLEGAYQFGKYAVAGQPREDRNAYAMQAICSYAFQNKLAPFVAFSWTYLSGSKRSGVEKMWDPMFYEKGAGAIGNAILPFYDTSAITLTGGVKPMEDITVTATYAYFRLAQKVASITSPNTNSANTSYGTYTMTDHKNLGNELDLALTYDYTEDVQFGLLGGIFMPGNAFSKSASDGSGTRSTATEVVGSMKVSF